MITLFSNNNSPNFGYRFPKNAVTDARFIPHLSCAKCGKKMLTLSEIDKIINNFRVSSSAAMNHDEFKSIQGTYEYECLADIAKQFPRISFARAINRKGVQKYLSYLPQETQARILDMVDISKGFSKKAPQVVKKLNPLKPLMPEIYLDLLVVMEDYAKKYPKLTFTEIFRKPEVMEHYRNIVESQRNQNTDTTNKIFKKIDAIMKQQPEELQKEYELVKSGLYKYNALIGEEHKFAINSLFKPILNKIQDKKIIEKISKQLDKIPAYNYGVQNVILRFSRDGYDDMRLFKTMLEDISNTFDHIIPDCYSHDSSASNGLYMHRRCNSNRRVFKYADIQEAYPEFKENIQKQLNKLMAFINAGKLTGMAEVPYKIKRNLDSYTHGKISPDIRNYLKQQKLRLEEQNHNLTTIREEHLEQFDRTRDEIQDVAKQMDELRKKMSQLKKEKNYYYECLKKDNKEINEAQIAYENFLKVIEKEKNKK